MIEPEELSYQFFEHLGEGLTVLLEREFGGDAYAASCRIIDWLRRDAQQIVLSEIACMMLERDDIILAYNSRQVGTLTTEFACLTRLVRDSVGMGRKDDLTERFSSLDVCRHHHPPV